MPVERTREVRRMNTCEIGEFNKFRWAGKIGFQNFADHLKPLRYTLASGIVSCNLRNELPNQPFCGKGSDWIFVTILPIDLLQQPLESRRIPALRLAEDATIQSRAS
jgi:hypothetical protein